MSNVDSKKIGYWTILQEEIRAIQYKNKRTTRLYCFCKCNCGTTKWIRKTSLVSGDSKSCGCFISKKMSDYRSNRQSGPIVIQAGKKIGKLVVQNEWKREKSGKSYVTKWKCKCDCGNIIWLQTTIISRNKQKSCGCLTKQLQSDAKKLPAGEAAFNSIFRQYCLRAKRKQVSFDLSIGKFKELTQQSCYYCGSGLSNSYSVEGNNGVFVYNGIDRINSLLGYTADNCVTCCKTCNIAKLDMSIAEFIKWIKRVYNYLLTKNFDK